MQDKRQFLTTWMVREIATNEADAGFIRNLLDASSDEEIQRAVNENSVTVPVFDQLRSTRS